MCVCVCEREREREREREKCTFTEIDSAHFSGKRGTVSNFIDTFAITV